MSALSRQQRFFGGINLPALTEFPSTPAMGDLAFKDGTLFIYAELGSLTSWMPISHKFTQYVHNQGTTLKKWIVRYPFNTDQVSVTVWGADREIIDANVTLLQDSETNEWYAEIDLAEPTAGYAIVFGTSEIGLSLAKIGQLEVSDQLTYAGERVLALSDRTALMELINQCAKTSEIQDILTSTATDKPLSANQGRVLAELVAGIQTIIASDATDLDSIQEIVNFIQLNRDTLDALTISSIAGLETALSTHSADIASLEDALNALTGTVSSMSTTLADKVDATDVFTKAEVNALLAEKADTSHNHSASNITSGTLASARLPASSSSARGGVRVWRNGTTGYIYTS